MTFANDLGKKLLWISFLQNHDKMWAIIGKMPMTLLTLVEGTVHCQSHWMTLTDKLYIANHILHNSPRKYEEGSEYFKTITVNMIQANIYIHKFNSALKRWRGAVSIQHLQAGRACLQVVWWSSSLSELSQSGHTCHVLELSRWHVQAATYCGGWRRRR